MKKEHFTFWRDSYPNDGIMHFKRSTDKGNGRDSKGLVANNEP